MEFMLQYLDDLDDLYGMAGLVAERVRNFVLKALICIALIAVAAASVWLAAVHPPVAMATSILLFVTLLYRSVTDLSANCEQPV